MCFSLVLVVLGRRGFNSGGLRLPSRRLGGSGMSSRSLHAMSLGVKRGAFGIEDGSIVS